MNKPCRRARSMGIFIRMIRALQGIKQVFFSHPRVCAFRGMVNGYGARFLCFWHWKFGVRTRRHDLPCSLVLSVTSYAGRFSTLHLTLRCLLRQTVRADRVVLWLSEQDFRLLPKEVLALQNEGLEIRITEDLKSYTKILPAIDAFPDASICTADDDVYYPPEWLEELVSEHDPQTVTCHRAHEIRFTADGKMLPYGSWDFDFRDSRTGTAIFPTGVGGVLYPPNVLAHDANDRRMAFELSPSNDDAWLYWMGRRNGAVYKRVGKWRSFLVWPGSQERALSKVNVQEGQNDIQFARLFDYYGSPEKKG